jgi:DNA adenine methylase
MPEQLAFPGFLDRAIRPPKKAKPIVKWLGGKSWIIKLAAKGTYQRLAITGGRYVEPFLGGGALGLHLGLPNMILSDLCKPLIDTYRVIIKHPATVGWALSALVAQGVDEPSYYRVRDSDPSSHVAAAARFLYLNKLGYNGVFRVNKKGKFNVPYGKKFADGENPYVSERPYADQQYRDSTVNRRTNDAIGSLFPSGRRLHDFSEALVESDVRTCDFRATLAIVRAGDVVFSDPPYASTFDAYTADGFGPEDQRDLADALEQAHVAGATVISTNADLPEVRELYGWADIIPTKEKRNVSQDGSKRKRAGCVLITNDQKILG